MLQRLVFISLLGVSIFLGYRLFKLEMEVSQLQTNCAIATLQADAANNKIGAISPYFRNDKEAFIRAWFDSANLPPAVFPDDVLIPLKRALEEKRNDKSAQELKAQIFK